MTAPFEPAVSEESRSELHRLIYTSEARGPGESGREIQLPVAQIAEEAAIRNAEAGLTGGLIAVRGHYVQILEGEAQAIEAVFERICRDMRHSAIQLVDYSPTDERQFEGWSMSAIDAEDVEDSESLEDLFLSIKAGMSPNALVRDLQAAFVSCRCAPRSQPCKSHA